MIKEYINKLLAENKETLKQLEKQLGDLMNELSSAEQWAESLQRESNAQTNIFSPRNIDVEIGQKIEKASNSISNINQQIEYVRDLIETHLRKQSEYEELMIEIDNMEYSNNSSDTNKTKTVSDEYFYQRRVQKRQIISCSACCSKNGTRKKFTFILSCYHDSYRRRR